MKKLEDYIHLYLGCRFILEDEDGNKRNQPLTTYNLNYYRRYLDYVKLLLRPISSMVTEEIEEYDRLLTHNNLEHSNTTVKADGPESFRWLLSKGFDIFGLIEAGLAIDKTIKVGT